MADIVCVRTFKNRIEAEIAKSRLEAEGIKAAIVLDDIGGMYPAVGGARLLVKEEDAGRAEQILA